MQQILCYWHTKSLCDIFWWNSTIFLFWFGSNFNGKFHARPSFWLNENSVLFCAQFSLRFYFFENVLSFEFQNFDECFEKMFLICGSNILVFDISSFSILICKFRANSQFVPCSQHLFLWSEIVYQRIFLLNHTMRCHFTALPDKSP